MQDKAVHVIREELEKQGLNAVKIILFGSRARGDFRPDSDWDFLVVIDKDMDRDEKRGIILQIKRQMAGLRIPNDIIINSFRQMQERANDVGYITYYALKEGVEL
jgi:predicted nucleotidyltransferase